MKSATLPPLRVSSDLRTAAESSLREGENLSSFVLEAVQLNIERREARRAFIERGLLARDEARATGQYVSSDEMLARLDVSLARARAKAGGAE
jgi:hypothetical protein